MTCCAVFTAIRIQLEGQREANAVSTGSMTRRASDASDATGIGRRTFLTGVGGAAAGMSFSTVASGSPPRLLASSAPDLPVWSQTEQFEEVTTRNGGTNRRVVLDRRKAVVTRSISQVNMKLWDDDDVVTEECTVGGTRSVGHQHRFVVATRVATAEELPLSYYHTLGYDLERRSRNLEAPIRVPVTRGLHAHDALRTEVSVRNDPCSPVTLRINAVNDRRIPAGTFSPERALLTADEFDYDADDLANDVNRYAKQSDPDPYMPESKQGLSGVASSVAGDVGTTASTTEAYLDTAQRIGVSALDAADDVSDFSRVQRLKGITSRIGAAASYAGLALDAYDVLSALGDDGGDPYLDETDWSSNRVVVNSTGSVGGVAIQFVDFTVTVPPGRADGNGVTVELSQTVSVDDLVPDGGKNALVREQQDVHPDDELLGTVSWEIDVPSYDVDDVRSVSETPTAYVVPGADGSVRRTVSRLSTDFADGVGGRFRAGRGDHRTDFETAPAPEFGVSLSASSITETESLSFEVDDYEDNGGSSYRWRVYKLGGVTQPYVYYGESGEIGANLLSRTALNDDPTIHSFGPGAYAAELTVRNRYGKVARNSAGFEVRPRADGVTGTEIELDALSESIGVGDTLTVDVSGTVGRDGTADSLDRVEWLLQYPATVNGGVRARNVRLRPDEGTEFDRAFDPAFDLRSVEWNTPAEPPKTTFEHTFDNPGIYRLAILAFSVDGDGGSVRNRYYGDGTPVEADRRDLTVFVGVDE